MHVLPKQDKFIHEPNIEIKLKYDIHNYKYIAIFDLDRHVPKMYRLNIENMTTLNNNQFIFKTYERSV